MTLDRLLQIVRLRLRSLVAGAAVDRELDEELRDHVERQVEAHIARGMTPEEARTLALRALGGVEQRKEEMRDARGRVGDRVPDPRPAAGVASAAEAARLCRDGDPVAGARHRRQHRDLPAAERACVPAAAGARAARARRGAARPAADAMAGIPAATGSCRCRSGSSCSGGKQAFSSMLAFGDTRFNLADVGRGPLRRGLVGVGQVLRYARRRARRSDA